MNIHRQASSPSQNFAAASPAAFAKIEIDEQDGDPGPQATCPVEGVRKLNPAPGVTVMA